jgi:hypothetical protein
MFEFADHATARLTAEACLRALFDPGNVGHADVPLLAKSATLTEAAGEVAAREAAGPPPGPLAELEARLETPMSKREFLRGKYLDHDAGG